MKAVVFLALFVLVVARPEEEIGAKILKQTQESHLDGSYQNGFELDDGTIREDSGHIETDEEGRSALYVEGSSSYKSPEGDDIVLTYTSGVGGYLARGTGVPEVPDYVIELVKYLLSLKKEEEVQE